MTKTPEPSAHVPLSPTRRKRRWRYLRRLAVLATLLLSLVLVGIRHALVQVQGREGEIAAWLSQQLGAPVRLGGIHGEWSGWAPSLALEDVSIGDPSDALKVGAIAVSIDPWRSLEAGEFLPDHLAIRGVDLVVRETSEGHWVIPGLPMDDSNGEFDLGRWQAALERLGTVGIEAERIRVESPRLPHTLELSPVALQLDGNRQALRVQLEGRLASPANGQIRARLDWDGGEHRRLYAEAEQLRVSDWSQWLGSETAPASGVVDLKLWLPLGQPATQPYIASLRARDLRAQGLNTANLSELDLTLQSAGWSAAGVNAIEFQINRARSPRGEWPQSRGLIRVERDATGWRRFEVATDFLRLDDLFPGEPLLAGLGWPGWSHLQGDLSGIKLSYQPDRPALAGVHLTAGFHGLGLQHAALGLQAGALSGQVDFAAGRGDVHLAATDLALSLPALPALPRLNQVDARLGLQLDERGWRLDIERLECLHPALAAGLSGRISQAAADQPALASLALAIHRGELKRLVELLPAHPKLAGTRRWMEHRLVDGRVSAGRGVLRGPLSGWPYADASGHAELALTVADAGVRFNDAWPEAKGLDAELRLRGARFELAAERAALLDAQLSEGRGSIEDIRADRPYLNLAFAIASDGPGTKAILNASPLKDGPGRRLARIDVGGPLHYQLKLNVPLFDGPLTTVDGVVQFANNRIGMGQDLQLTKLQGELGFTRDTWGGEGIDADYDGRAVTVAAGSVADAAGGGTRIALAGRMDRDYLAAQVARHAGKVSQYFQRHALWPRFSGESDFLAEVRIPPSDGPADAETLLTITSSLQGLALDLPAPLGKPAASTTPVKLTTGLDSQPNSRLIELTLGSTTAAKVRLTRPGTSGSEPSSKVPAEREFFGAEVVFGGGSAATPERRGVAVKGDLTLFRLSDWLLVLSPPKGEDDGYDDSLDPLRLEVRVADLEAFGQRFPSITVSGQRALQRWQLKAASGPTQGEIDWPLTAGQARLRFERLSLVPDPDAVTSGADDDSDPASLPAIEASAQEFKFAGNQLGRMRLMTEPSSGGRGLTLKELRFASERFTATATGRWQGRGRGQESDFEIDLESPDLGRLLGSFGYDTAAIEGGKTAMRIDARWPGGPDDFSLDVLQGELELHIKQGRLLEVDPKAGRLFGLLSLQTLPRRLALDFGDVFGKGFGFDTIDGRFQIVAGNAHTEDLTMVGPAARIEVKGRTGLATRDYDQQVVVIPALSSNLPVASALFGPVGVGVGAALYLSQQVFKQIPGAIDSVLSQRYSVTGSWTDPIITKQAATAAESAPPGPG